MEEFKYLIPEESTDAATLNARKLRELEAGFRKVFDRYGYEELMLPSFEYVDLYHDFAQEEEKMFQFVNHEGKRIALRTDFSVPIARLYNNANTADVGRYSYFGKVYRVQERHKGRASELYQGGVELMGLPGKDGDRECLEVLEATLSTLPLTDVKLEFGSAKFFRRLNELVNDERLKDILDRKATSKMQAFVKDLDVDDNLKALLLALPSSFGDIDDLLKVKALCKDGMLVEAIENLEYMYEKAKDKSRVMFDLCMIPTQRYYTGIMVKAYTYHSAQPILSGGRYDNLFRFFDRNVAAIGFSYRLDSVLNAIRKEEETQ